MGTVPVGYGMDSLNADVVRLISFIRSVRDRLPGVGRDLHAARSLMAELVGERVNLERVALVLERARLDSWPFDGLESLRDRVAGLQSEFVAMIVALQPLTRYPLHSIGAF